MSVAITDRIEKKVVLRAPRNRVWRALTDVKEFATWFGVKFDTPFTPGARLRGVIVGTAVDAAASLSGPRERRSRSASFTILGQSSS